MNKQQEYQTKFGPDETIVIPPQLMQEVMPILWKIYKRMKQQSISIK